MSQAPEYTMSQRLGAEALGTFWLVFGGCGTAIFAATAIPADAQMAVGVGWLGVAFAFGLTVLTGAYAFGPVSGGHFNPAVTVGLAMAKRFSWRDLPGYVVAQVVGATVAGAVLLVIAEGIAGGFDPVESGFASNGYGDRSPMGYNLGSVIVAEVVLTAVFLFVILGATAKRAAVGFAGLSIGMALTLIHLISIPISNTSVNPARSLGVAWFAGSDALLQVWVFILAPIVGAAIAGFSHDYLLGPDNDPEPVEPPAAPS
ncbi:aquaporin Z [Aeromicrobium sp. 636]|uniref:Aquaporin Z n=1 Tax=Aeromicrobium senzhongii TaxID=2663859 RepID=A0A8I0EVT0_9ACTN|nr:MULTISPECIES: aquaporin Z [Aeromicrobium]MBC9227145.1 aquaporin Z [Aeromicrobium senzhongii]MCQ3999244.1 aquaporin Z [Aeromicrobium sp. 636]MTB88448.1 aquaporin Z [Aeromicrobium senzhongii]QNL94587.1 aquaporin Z [Aeromicrobium senzhongii]